MKKHIKLLFSCIVALTACTTTSIDPIAEIDQPLKTRATSDYLCQIDQMAKAVNAALCESSDFRYLLKQEAMKCFDGDYDVMLRPLSLKSLNDVTTTRSSNGKTTVGDLLNDIMLSDSKAGDYDIVKSLYTSNPLLQISIPVHAEEWDPETYIPTVVYDAKDFGASKSNVIGGYNAKGQYVELDAIKEPDVPVIVIGCNERCGEDICLNNYDILRTPATEQSLALSATLILSGVKLQWVSDPLTAPWRAFEVYRKAVDLDSFTKVMVISAPSARSYTDAQISSNTTYQYFVRGFDGLGGVFDSNIISIDIPATNVTSLHSFTVAPINLTQIRLNWTKEQNSPNSVVKLYRKRLSSTANDQMIATITNTSVNQYYDTPLIKGEKYLYTAYNCINGVYSNPYYDVTYLPYRDISTPSPIYIKYIETNLNDRLHLETWFDGSPEFKIKCNVITGETGTVSSFGGMTIGISGGPFNYHSFQSYSSNNLLCNWVPNTPYDKMLISIVEVDDGVESLLRTYTGNALRKIGANIGLESEGAKGSINFEDNLGINVVLSYSPNDVYICDKLIYYFENPSITINGGYGFVMQINDTNE